MTSDEKDISDYISGYDAVFHDGMWYGISAFKVWRKFSDRCHEHQETGIDWNMGAVRNKRSKSDIVAYTTVILKPAAFVIFYSP